MSPQISMPSSFPEEEEDDDSLYDECTKVPYPQGMKLEETVLDPSLVQVQRLDSVLDRQDELHLEEQQEEEEDRRNDAHVRVVTDLVEHDEDDWFDLDEKKVDVESMESSSEEEEEEEEEKYKQQEETKKHSSKSSGLFGKGRKSINIPLPRASTSYFHSQASTSSSKSSNNTGFALLTKASQTFYKAFRRKKSTPVPAPADGTREEVYQRHQQSIQQTEERIMRIIDAQLATLGGAKSGYVDLTVVRSNTKQAAELISRDAKFLLQDFQVVKEEANKIAKTKSNIPQQDLEREERVLVDAKLAVAQANDDVEHLRYELKSVRKLLQDPGRKQWGMVRKVEQIRKDACAVKDARLDVEKRLKERDAVLNKERLELSRLEDGIRDIEGDWA